MNNIEIKEWERIDNLQLNGLQIIQDTRGFCFGLDAVLLSSFADIKKGDYVIDLGTGTGIIPILVAGKTEAMKIDGLEIQAEMATMATRSVELNRLQDKITIFELDLRHSVKMLGTGKYDIVTCNPPYMNQGGGLVNPQDMKAVSRHEIMCTLEDVISVSSKFLKAGGKFAMVHRPERLVDIIWLMRNYKVEPKRLRFVHPSPGKKANLILIEGVRFGKPYLKMMEPLYVRDENGKYTKEIDRIYGRVKEVKSNE